MKLNIKFKLRGKNWKLILLILLLLIPINVHSAIVYYEPSSNITIGWIRGTGANDFYEIDDGTRQSSIPNTADYLSSRVNDGTTSEFGFASLNTSNRSIRNMTLWVYTGTGTNAQYTFNLYQTGVSRCSTLNGPNLANTWRQCSWTTPSGNYNALSMYLGTVARVGGGSTYAYVYSAYLEVFEDFFPVVNLTAPRNATLSNKTYFDFNFSVTDDITSTLPNCSLWGNFTGAWAKNRTITNVANNSNNNISITLIDGNYIWNAECYDSAGNIGTYHSNFTLNVDSTPPNIYLVYPQNNTLNTSHNELTLQYNFTDRNPVSNCSLYINSIYENSTANPLSNTIYSFTKTFANGNYTWYVSCIDSANSTGKSPLFYLNVSYTMPSITNIFINENITLIPDGFKPEYCNISVYHPQGASQISGANATLSLNTVQTNGIDDYNNHYTNQTCLEISSSGNFKNFTCGFYLAYYSINGSWNCNATALTQSAVQLKNSTSGNVMPMYALNVSDWVIDYGDVTAGQYSAEKSLQVKNAGNMPINISVRGYGGNNPSTGDGLAFTCALRNISIENERFDILPSVPFASKNQLSSVNQDMKFTMQKQGIEGSIISQDTFWQVYVPPGKVNLCTGTVVFTASNP